MSGLPLWSALGVPHRPVVIATALPPLLWLVWLGVTGRKAWVRRRRRRLGLCLRCGYDLRGSPSGACPECGAGSAAAGAAGPAAAGPLHGVPGGGVDGPEDVAGLGHALDQDGGYAQPPRPVGGRPVGGAGQDDDGQGGGGQCDGWQGGGGQGGGGQGGGGG